MVVWCDREQERNGQDWRPVHYKQRQRPDTRRRAYTHLHADTLRLTRAERGRKLDAANERGTGVAVRSRLTERDPSGASQCGPARCYCHVPTIFASCSSMSLWRVYTSAVAWEFHHDLGGVRSPLYVCNVLLCCPRVVEAVTFGDVCEARREAWRAILASLKRLSSTHGRFCQSQNAGQRRAICTSPLLDLRRTTDTSPVMLSDAVMYMDHIVFVCTERKIHICQRLFDAMSTQPVSLDGLIQL